MNNKIMRNCRALFFRLVAGLILCSVPVALSAAVDQDALASIQESGVLLWGSDAEGGAPYVFPDPDNPSTLIGFEVDLADAIARELHVTARQFQIDWNTLLPGLQRGDFHIAMNGIEHTAERSQEVAFSDPYYIFSQQLVVRAEDDAVHSLNDLRGKVVGTLGGTVAQDMLESAQDIEVKIYEGQVEPYRDLKLGRTDAVFMDLPIAAHYARPDPALRYAGPPVGTGVYAICLRKDDNALLSKINEILKKLYRSGELKSIYEKWGLWNFRQVRLQDKKHVARAVFQSQKAQGWGAYIPILLKGAGMTVIISILAMTLAVVLGMGLTLLRRCGNGTLTFVARSYIEIIRGTPLLLQLYIIYYGLPNIGINLDAFTAAVLGLGMNYAAYETEIYRAGLDAIPREQTEGAASLGMGPFMIYRRILIPQAVKITLPAVTNDFISLFKDSSLVSIIAIVELTKSYNMLAVSSMRYLELGLLTGVLYLAMSFPLSLYSQRLERKMSPA